MVALTQSVNFGFGAGFRGKRTGIIFNDEMDDFSIPGKINDFGIPPSEVNFIVPGKRPQSSTCPSIIKRNGKNLLSVGGSGGSKITTAVTQNIISLLNFKMNITDIVAGDRIHHQLSPMKVQYQPKYDKEILDGLIDKGHEIEEYSYRSSSAGTIHKLEHGFWEAKSDNRKPDSTPKGL